MFAIYYIWNQTHNPVGARELHYNCATPDKDTRYEVQLVFEFNSTTILTVKHTKKTKITKRRSPCTTCGPRTTVCAPPLLLLWQCNMIRAEWIEALHTSIPISATEAVIMKCLSITLGSGYVVFHAIWEEVTFMPCLILDNYYLNTLRHFKLWKMPREDHDYLFLCYSSAICLLSLLL